jgi:hypothetical protein
LETTSKPTNIESVNMEIIAIASIVLSTLP